ncbi:MAG: YdcF family protein [Provencibacterium sp.]|jgi:uncharacterized SAM-binding protein YcdF (DUF218 family)|nr:YdcF family protein [Provencibacterium sp.]
MRQILQDIGNFIFLKDPPEKADAILVVGGSRPELAEIAADLWKEGYAPLVFIGGGVSIKTGTFPGPQSKQDIYSKKYQTEYDFYRDVLLINGVAERAILGENRSSFTRENAFFARQAFDEKQLVPEKILLVCQNFHARRCLMFFQSAFPDTQFSILPFEGTGLTKEDWFLSENGVQRVLGELARCGNQFDFSDIRRYTHLQDG